MTALKRGIVLLMILKTLNIHGAKAAIKKFVKTIPT